MAYYKSIKDWLEMALSSRLARYRYRRPRCRSHKFKIMRKKERQPISPRKLLQEIKKGLRSLHRGPNIVIGGEDEKV